jgi:hypothetical protein
MTYRALISLTSRKGTHSQILKSRLPAVLQYLQEEMETQSPPNGVMHLPRSLCNDPSSVPSLLSRTCATTSITACREDK